MTTPPDSGPAHASATDSAHDPATGSTIRPSADNSTTAAVDTHTTVVGKVPIPTLERLTTYLRCLIDAGAAGVETISSAQIEEQSAISAAQFRKDISYFGEFGKPGVGYSVAELESRLARILQIHKVQPILLIGAGNLGSALAAYPGLQEHKFHIVAAFDTDPNRIGKRLWNMDIQDFQRIESVNAKLGAKIAILAVPATAAQAAADALVEQAGIRAILNFAPVLLRVPSHVIVRNVSFLQELAVLSYHLTESSDSPTDAEANPDASA